MFYSISTNRRINNLHEKALSMKHNDYELTSEKVLKKDGSFIIHHYNIQARCIELHKVYNNLSQTFPSDLFTRGRNFKIYALNPDGKDQTE